MTRRAAVPLAEITRALKAAKAAGVRVKVVVEGGRIEIIPLENQSPNVVPFTHVDPPRKYRL